MKFTSSKLWSFGKKPKDSFTLKKSTSPSPLDYQNTNYRSTTPNWKIGSAKRENKVKNTDLPGPGNYKIPTTIGEGPVFKIREPKNNEFAHDNKIPSSSKFNADSLAYNPNYKINCVNVAYSIKGKNKENFDNKVPGPGTYEKVIKSSSTPAYSITKTPRKDNFVNETVSPGPATYYQDNYPAKNTTRVIKFSIDEKLKPVRSITPGPGNYDTKPAFGYEGKIVSLRGKPSYLDSSKDLPGPGAYNPKDDYTKLNTKASVKLMNPSKSVTHKELKEIMPGPGQYSPDNRIVSNFKNIPKWTLGNKTLSSSLYTKLDKIHGALPAPGEYDLDRSLGDGPKFSIGAKSEVNYDNKIPGPGHYQNDRLHIRDTSPIWKFGTSTRSDFLNTSTNIAPAPGTYCPDMIKSVSSFKFSKEEKIKPIKSETPGPGHYKIPCSIADAPSYVNTNSEFKRI